MKYSDYRRLGRKALEGNWGLSIFVSFVAAIFGGLCHNINSGITYTFNPSDISKLSSNPQQAKAIITTLIISFLLIRLILGGTVLLGHCTFLLKQYDRKGPTFGDLFSQFHRYSDGLCLNLLTSIYTILWTLLFIIPGIIASYSYAMAPFILAENPEYTPTEAIEASKKLMLGHKRDLFILELTFLGWEILSVLTAGIGLLWLNPYKAATRVAFYRDIQLIKVKTSG